MPKFSYRGKRKYRCAECKHEQFVHWVERARRTRFRCSNCGSTWLYPVTKEGVEDLRAEGDNREIGPTGSVIMGKGDRHFERNERQG
jgi:DNA-directed RNA polymerase subunit RPC12/RpoP